MAEVWRSHISQRGLMQPMSVAVLERFVLSKPYFDRDGVILAVEGDKLLGFSHAGFGPSADHSRLSCAEGVVAALMVRPDADAAVAGELLARSEAYLRGRGAQVLYGGGLWPIAPFYYGLIGGSEPAGVLASDPRTQSLFESHGYEPLERSVILHRDLGQFRPVVDRQQMQIRRHTAVSTIVDPPPASWWEACIFEAFERAKVMLTSRDGGTVLASAVYWNMETMAATWGVRAIGIVDLVVGEQKKRQGHASYLLGETLRQFHQQGVSLAEARVDITNAPAFALFSKLGFTEVDRSTRYRKV
jgi:ribosomal protein S18 acetylase RimI-like enzyme